MSKISKNSIKSCEEVDQKLKPALKIKSLTHNEEEKIRKRVSFAKRHLKSRKIKKLENKQKFDSFISTNNSDSDDDQLFIDLSQEYDPSISDSTDSYDEKIQVSSDSDVSEKDSQLLDNFSKTTPIYDNNYSRIIDNVQNYDFNDNEEEGDPSRVIEITIDSEEDDKCEVIGSQTTPAQDIKEEITVSSSSQESNTSHTSPQIIVRQKHIHNKLSTPANSKQSSHTNITINQIQQIGEYYCVLCPKLLKSCESLVEHYLGHCGVYLECGECHQKFESLQAFRTHNTEHLDRNNMLNLEAFMNAKKWCDHYTQYIQKHDDIVKQVINVNQMFCPVCHRICQLFHINGNSQSKEDITKFSLDEDSISNHLHQHLQYFPYECIDCKFEDKKTAFCLNSKARQHIQKEHNVENACDLKLNQLKSYFDGSKCITKLDNVINNCFNLSIKIKSFSDRFALMSDKQNIR